VNEDSLRALHTGLDTRASGEATRIAATGLAAVREARTTAEIARQAYQMTLPPEERLRARTDRVPVMVAGPPEAALETAVAMLATSDAAAALALELSLAFDDATQVATLTAAVIATSRCARLGARALQMHGARALRIQLAHATAMATHQVADALNLRRSDRSRSTTLRPRDLGQNRFPPAGRDVVIGLGSRLTYSELDDQHEAERVGAAAARDAAEHLVGAYEHFQAIGGADGAVRRYARIAALASAYAGWSSLEMSVDTAVRGDAPIPPQA
jgi:hypothetical protein